MDVNFFVLGGLLGALVLLSTIVYAVKRRRHYRTGEFPVYQLEAGACPSASLVRTRDVAYDTEMGCTTIWIKRSHQNGPITEDEWSDENEPRVMTKYRSSADFYTSAFVGNRSLSMSNEVIL